MASTSDSAIWATTRPLRRREEPAPRLPRAPLWLSASPTSTREARSAGNRPKPTAVITETAAVNSSTRPSVWTSSRRGNGT